MKYEVHITQTESYDIEVEADNEDEAEKKAWDLFDAGKQDYFSDCDGSCEVNELDED